MYVFDYRRHVPVENKDIPTEHGAVIAFFCEFCNGTSIDQYVVLLYTSFQILTALLKLDAGISWTRKEMLKRSTNEKRGQKNHALSPKCPI